MALATVAILMMPRTYVATSAVIFQGDRPEVIRLGDTQSGTPFGSDTLASEIELLTSEELLETVVKKLDPVSDPEFNPAVSHDAGFTLPENVADFIEPVLNPIILEGQKLLALVQPKKEVLPAVDGSQKELSSTVIAVRSRLGVYPVGVSRVIHITFTSRRPATAFLIANTVADVYVDTLLTTKTKAAQEAHSWIDQRLRQALDPVL